jgi:hypothetical protein
VLQVTVFSSVVGTPIIITARILLPDGKIVPNQWNAAAINGRQAAQFYRFLPEGFLLSLCVEDDTTLNPGTTFVTVAMIQGGPRGTLTQVLLQGYTTRAIPLTWPPSVLSPATGGRGHMRVITGTTPAAGQEINEVVPADVLWRLVTFQFGFIAAAATPQRYAFVIFDDGSTIHSMVQFVPNLSVTLAQTFTIGTGYQQLDLNIGAPQTAGITDHYIQSGFRIRTSTSNLAAGDQYNSVHYLVEEWLNL